MNPDSQNSLDPSQPGTTSQPQQQPVAVVAPNQPPPQQASATPLAYSGASVSNGKL